MVSVEDLRQGDFVFYCPVKKFNIKKPLDYFVSKIIAIFSPKKIHVALVLNDPKLDGVVRVLSAEWYGVDIITLDPNRCYTFKRLKKVHISNIRKGLILSINKFYRKQYGYNTAFIAAMMRVVGLKTLYKRIKPPTCSYVGAEFAFDSAGIKIKDLHAHDVLPDDLYDSDQLRLIGAENGKLSTIN